ncbi:MAG: sporulation protein [Paenibacillus sp.]|jgi:stage II sporulation protein B|nr:sporulation protein [Paenibacillus sp.]
MNKARITYRFDDPGRETVRKEPNPVIPLMKEEFTVIEDHASVMPVEEHVWPKETSGRSRIDFVDTQPLNQFTTDFGAWKSPFDAETDKVERIIRESATPRRPEPIPEQERYPTERYPAEREARHDGDTGYYETEWTEPQAGRYGEERIPPTVIRGRYERYNRTPWLKIVASVSGAVATGVLIGFFVLSMFGGDDPPSGVQGPAGSSGKSASTLPVQTKTPAVDPSGGKDNTAPASTASAATVSVNIAAQSYTLLQNGVFSNEQGAAAAAAELKKKGLAAFVQPGDKYYVYVGMSPSHDDALALGNVLKEQKMELFLKAMAQPAVSKIRWSGEQSGAAEPFFTQSNKLVQTIGSFSVARLKEKTPSAIDDKTLQTIHSAHQAWTGASGPFGAGIAQDQKAVLQKWTTAMNTAVTSMDEYKKNPSSALLWEAQSSLMQVLFAENELLAAIKAQ